MRKFIDILNEFLLGDFGGEGGGSSTVLVFNIHWDTDGVEVDLPAEFTMEVDGEDEPLPALASSSGSFVSWPKSSTSAKLNSPLAAIDSKCSPSAPEINSPFSLSSFKAFHCFGL